MEAVVKSTRDGEWPLTVLPALGAISEGFGVPHVHHAGAEAFLGECVDRRRHRGCAGEEKIEHIGLDLFHVLQLSSEILALQ